MAETAQDLAEAKALVAGGQTPGDLAGQVAAAEAALAPSNRRWRQVGTTHWRPSAGCRRQAAASTKRSRRCGTSSNRPSGPGIARTGPARSPQ